MDFYSFFKNIFPNFRLNLDEYFHNLNLTQNVWFVLV